VPGQSPEEWSTATRQAFDGTVSTARGRPLHLPAVIAHQSDFLPPYIEWAKAIALGGAVPARQSAILALRTAWNCKSEFEWGVHVERASDSGALSPAEIVAVAGGSSASRWGSLEAALVAAADEMWSGGTITDETWAVLAAAHDRSGLVEISLIIGHYTMLAMVANSTGVPAEARWAALGEASIS
jgi:4-carboxymuconolactone decarboxylase